MGLLHRHTSTRAVWTFLRRTRERLTFFGREVPGAGQRINPVIEAILSAETQMLAEDPDLPLRRVSREKAAPDPDAARVHDLSRRVEELETAVRIREEQIAMIAHDLRGPLSPVLMLVSRLQAQLASLEGQPVPASELRPRVDAVAHRLAMFVAQLNTMLEGTRLQTHDLALDPEPVDLAAVARELVEEIRAGVFRPPEVSVTGPVSMIGHWDRLRIEQIVRNLLSNALRFGAHAPIEVQVDGNAESAILIVRDHGIGILPADHKRIFEKHVRIGSGKGFGLGLWIVKQLVDAMGGSVTVTSAPGAGAEFKVVLPVAH